MSRGVTVEGLSGSPKEDRAITLAVGHAIGRPAADAQAILARLPVTLPKRFDDHGALELALTIRELGGKAELTEEVDGARACASHPDFEGDFVCERCGARACSLCAARPSPLLCERCAGRASRSRAFYWTRVSVLLTVLAGVLLYAYRDVASRRARHSWDHTLRIAVVILRRGDVDEGSTRSLARRLDALDSRLAAELSRRRPGAPRPFAFSAFGPLDVTENPPSVAGDGVIDLARHAWDLRQYLGRVDSALGITPSAFDARIYVVVRRPASADRSAVEGESEQDGRVGTVEVELDREMVDLALIVVAHELFHTLGATDKYDSSGRTLIPDGLAEPTREPRFPQPFVEVMTRNRPISASEDRVPERLSELAVGPITAREIGWEK